MKHYIEISETLQRVVEVEADCLNDALQKVHKEYNDGVIVLDAQDVTEVNISPYNM